MGQRACVQFKYGQEESPIVYTHWGGEDIPRLIADTLVFMHDRLDDIQYVAARFVGIVHDDIGQHNTGLGMWCPGEGKTVADNDPGDNGAFLVDLKNGIVVNHAGGSTYTVTFEEIHQHRVRPTSDVFV